MEIFYRSISQTKRKAGKLASQVFPFRSGHVPKFLVPMFCPASFD